MTWGNWGVIPTPILVNPETEPVTLDEAKRVCRQDTPVDDDMISSYITAARQWFEAATDRQFCTATWRVKLPSFWPGPGRGWSWGGSLAPLGWGASGAWSRIELPYPPLVSVSSVQYLDMGTNTTLTLATTVYNVVTSRTPGCLELAFGQTWPVTAIHPEAVTITFVAGYGAPGSVPELVKNGIKMLVRYWYDNPNNSNTGIPPMVEQIALTSGAKRF